ncbi:hypothetical protein JKI95_03005 [Corynebacterium aquatimens]|uniref:hypothetical protein n=1 Tax=Corynebacterium TaxID=1716 RepID=UPI001F48C6CA|nr:MULTISPECIES: hypothetical protein [Corynebacterium]QYH20021.1 hypothetical protein JKI95_03005 [Corynebacterium aquatimens]UIZ92782.1 hypothetical protein JZY91_03170 [Corynebacterium sp. CNCTC7651]
MGFMDWLRGTGREQLVEMPTQFERVEVQELHVHTANLSPDTDEKLVILSTTPAALEEIRYLRGAVQLVSEGERAVTFVPSKSAIAPVLDPHQGWIIPVSPATAHELQALPAGPGEHELGSIHLGLVLG